MAYRWETADSVWWEEEAGGPFELAAGRGLGRVDWRALPRGRWPDLARLLGASLPAACGHGAIYPGEFAYCPECGQALTRRVEGAERPAWWGATSQALPAHVSPLPRHVPHGLPVTAMALAAALEARPPEPAVGRAELHLPVPPNALCVFAAARFGFAAQRLLALAHTRNVLQYWDPLALEWHVMTPEEGAADLGFSASAYAWLPAGAGARRGEVAVVPTAQGLQRLLIDPVNLSYRTESLFQAPLAGAPGAVARQIACLFVGPEGLCLWNALPDGADGELLPCAGADLPTAGWRAPLAYDGKLIWLHERGQLVWRPGADPQWLAWPPGWLPRLAFGGPARSRHGLLWQIGHDGTGYSFLELGRAGGRLERIDGARLGFDTLLFRRGHQVKDEPWGREDVEDQHQGDALVLPLLENVVATRSQPTGLVLRIEQFSGTAEAALGGAVLARTSIEWIGRRNVILDQVARLSDPADCLPFVYDDCLWLHHPKWNEIRGWRLKAAP